MWSIFDPCHVDARLDSRAVTFENPSGGRGAGGQACGGRKGAPSRRITPGETVTLADLRGPGTLRHVWMTFQPAPPERMRGVWMEVFYDGADEPSISVPCLDFFGLPHGRPVPYASLLTAAQEGRGFNAYFPMPFRDHVRVQLTNSAARPIDLYYQIDYTLEPDVSAATGYLHTTFRRENPTTRQRDFVIADGWRGPGRFLGCTVGIRTIDAGFWYGEGEVKIYRDGDADYPTICGTGLEDYVGSAWGLGVHHTPYAGTPLEVHPPESHGTPDFVGFYRWHLADPIMFGRSLRVTIQQIGFALFVTGQEREFEAYTRANPAAGQGWQRSPRPGVIAQGIAERVDDYCATAYVYCLEPQPVPRLDVSLALADIARRPYEIPHPFETAFG